MYTEECIAKRVCLHRFGLHMCVCELVIRPTYNVENNRPNVTYALALHCQGGKTY